MTEKGFYKNYVRPFFLKRGCFVHRFESTSVPDVYVAKNNKVLWVELKCVDYRRGIVKPDWRTGQLAWIKEHEQVGNNNICLLLCIHKQAYFLKPQKNYKEDELVCKKDHYLKMLME